MRSGTAERVDFRLNRTSCPRMVDFHLVELHMQAPG